MKQKKKNNLKNLTESFPDLDNLKKQNVRFAKKCLVLYPTFKNSDLKKTVYPWGRSPLESFKCPNFISFINTYELTLFRLDLFRALKN